MYQNDLSGLSKIYCHKAENYLGFWQNMGESDKILQRIYIGITIVTIQPYNKLCVAYSSKKDMHM